MADATEALVIGGGPAGLMAAGAMAEAGLGVTVAEAKPSLGRKFLMAGKSGLNLTTAAPPERMHAAYAEAAGWLAPMLDAFGPDEIRAWAEGLGQPLFTGSSGRVFPVAMKASPLLRAWLGRLGAQGVRLAPRWRWEGFDDGGALRFATPEGVRALRPPVTVLALGGASWPRLGADAAWVPWLAARGVDIAPFRPANMGFSVAWSAHMARHFGTPVKGAMLCAGSRRARGEFVISARGLEGGGIYAVSRALREGAALRIDLLPDRPLAEVAARLATRPARESAANSLRKLGLGAGAVALVNEFARPLPTDPGRRAALLKALPAPLAGPRPLAEAISSAGGIRAGALDGGLMLRSLPGMFAAGEMLDWEAPTGGFLLTACLATGRWAGREAARHVMKSP